MRRVVRLLMVAIVVAGLAAGCKSAFRGAVEEIATNVGRNADDVERAMKAAMPNAPEAELEAAASTTATRTRFVPSLATQMADQWERLSTERAVAGAACEVVDVYQETGRAVTQDEVRKIVQYHVRLHQLPETEAKIIDVTKGLIEQIDSAMKGRADARDLAVSLACLPF